MEVREISAEVLEAVAHMDYGETVRDVQMFGSDALWEL